MELLGDQKLAAPRKVVWEMLNDPVALKSCLRGCDRLEKMSDSTFEATIAANVGPIKATFVGWMTLSDVDPPKGYTIAFEGKGGAAGFAKGQARVRLTEAEAGTLLEYAVNASLGGKLGQMGSRVVDGVARQLAADFFAQFAEFVGTAATSLPGPSSLPGEDMRATKSARHWILAGIGLAVLIILAFLLLR